MTMCTLRLKGTKTDWAKEIVALLDTRYADCDQVTLVCDNLNTRAIGVFYEVYPPKQARADVRRINLVWLFVGFNG